MLLVLCLRSSVLNLMIVSQKSKNKACSHMSPFGPILAIRNLAKELTLPVCDRLTSWTTMRSAHFFMYSVTRFLQVLKQDCIELIQRSRCIQVFVTFDGMMLLNEEPQLFTSFIVFFKVIPSGPLHDHYWVSQSQGSLSQCCILSKDVY